MDEATKTRIEDNTDMPSIKRTPTRKKVVIADGPKIIIDLSEVQNYSEQQTELVSQVSTIYAANKAAKKSLPLIITSLNLSWKQLFHRINAFNWNKKLVTFQKESLEKSFPNPERLVYLSPYSENVCEMIEPDKCYIIGYHTGNKEIPEDIKNRHIKTERIPIPNDLQPAQVARVIINVANGSTWENSLVR